MLKKLLILIAVAAFFTACNDSKEKYVYVPVNPDPGVLMTQTYTVDFEGPGGHSNGAYGRVNAVHAASRVMIALDEMKPAAGFNLLNISGGNSVNSIAFDGKLIVQAIGTAEQLKVFESDFKLAVGYGVMKENDFRKTYSGQTDSNGVRLDVRAKITAGAAVKK